MNKRKYICIAALLLTAFLAAAGALCLKSLGENTPPAGLGIADMSLTAEKFCSALNSGDLETIDGMINGYSSLNLTAVPDSSASAKLRQCLTDSYDSRLSGSGSSSGMTAEQEIEVSYFSAPLASEDIKQLTQQQYDALLAQTSDTADLYDEEGNLTEERAMALYEESVDRIVADSHRYTVTETITLQMVFENGRWEIVLDDSLVRVLLGGMGS